MYVYGMHGHNKEGLQFCYMYCNRKEKKKIENVVGVVKATQYNKNS